MEFDDLKVLYEEKKEEYGDEAYKCISQLLRDAKGIHKQDWEKNKTPAGDHEQSWRAFKGKNLEKLIQFIITDEVEDIGLAVLNGNEIDNKAASSDAKLSTIKRNLLIDYGEYGCHLPDVDIIIYNPESLKVIVVISIKVTLRDRIAQTAYWKLKLMADEITKHVKVYFVTLDEDETLTTREPIKKARAIVETDLDGTYVLTEGSIEETKNVKLFEHFIEDLSNLLKKPKKNTKASEPKASKPKASKSKVSKPKASKTK